MSLFQWLRGGTAAPPEPRVRAAAPEGGIVIRTPAGLEEALRSGRETASGQVVSSMSAMQNAAVFACYRIITGAVANMPLHIMRYTESGRQRADETTLARVLGRRPTPWLRPSQYRRLLTGWVLTHGNAYGLKVLNARKEVDYLLPMHPSRVEVEQLDTQEVVYHYQPKKGARQTFRREEVQHLFLHTLDGITGVTPITYARETIGFARAMQDHASKNYKNGMRASGYLSTEKRLSEEAHKRLVEGLAEYREGGMKEGRDLILEDGLKYEPATITARDAQWIEGQKLSRTDIFMFFGLPPHMAGDTEKSTSWGSGLEEQREGFNAYTLEDYLTMWEESVTHDLSRDPSVYAVFERNALARANLGARADYYTKMVQFGILSPNEVREREDINPRDGGDIFYPPPNMNSSEGEGDEPPTPTGD